MRNIIHWLSRWHYYNAQYQTGKVAMGEAYAKGDYTMSEIADDLGVSYPVVSQALKNV